MLIINRKAGQGIQFGRLELTVTRVNNHSVTIKFEERFHEFLIDDIFAIGSTTFHVLLVFERFGNLYVDLGIKAPRHVKILRSELRKNPVMRH